MSKRKEPVDLVCRGCGEAFQRHPKEERRRVREGLAGPFCGRTCSSRYAGQLRSERASVNLWCAECGAEFSRPGHKERQRKRAGSEGPFCSRSCRSTWSMRERVPDPPHTVERFMEKWEYDRGCWRWTAGTHSAGYGVFNGKQLAHRFAYRQFYGEAPPDGQVLHHTCENPACVHPLHVVPMSRSEHASLHHG